MQKATRISICLAGALGALALILLAPWGRVAASGGIPVEMRSTLTGTPSAESDHLFPGTRPWSGREHRADTCTITSTADSGTGTLRWCLGHAAPFAYVDFDPAVFPPTTPMTIELASELPHIITDGLTIDASNAGVILDGSRLADSEDGVRVDGADYVTVRGLQVVGFPDDGIELTNGASWAVIGGDRSIGNGPLGQGNLTSGNGDNGISIRDAGTVSNTVVGNFAGTNLSGSLTLSNTCGVSIWEGASGNTVGSSNPGENNLLSGNGRCGVLLGSNATNNRVVGNWIGTDVHGTSAISNGWIGVCVWGRASYNQIGGDQPGERNLISGNDGNGVQICDSGTISNVVVGNYIGTNVSGTAALPNTEVGVAILGEASHNVVGGDTPEQRNLISGNGYSGVAIFRARTVGNRIVGNYVGTDVTGQGAIANRSGGVTIFDGASDNLVGGETAAERNLISGNIGTGVTVHDLGTIGNVIVGNFIGTDASGSKVVSNTEDGIALCSETTENLLENNLISGNGDDGVCLNGVTSNTVRGNHIGTDPSGMIGLGNADLGVDVYESRENRIKANLVSGNGSCGVWIRGTGATSNTVVGNYIGTNIHGTAAISNAWNGIVVGSGASWNTIGGTTAGERNLLSGNEGAGIAFHSSGTSNNTALGNYIGTNISGTAALPNTRMGVDIWGGPTDNTVGGDAADAGNLISGNGGDGVQIGGSGTASNTISSNYIGTDRAGSVAIPNADDGVSIHATAADNTITGNLISGNSDEGVIIGGGTLDNHVTRNLIGTDVTGSVPLPNAQEGVYVWDGAQRSLIGPANTIAFNGMNGVYVQGLDTLSHTITANSIFGNIDKGILLADSGNAGIASPAVFTVTATWVTGTAPSNATIEVFSDDTDEGRIYEGSTTSSGTGQWILRSKFSGPYLTATATDAAGNTSEFSDPFPVPPPSPQVGDDYEPDDTCAEASDLATNGTPQQHTFHDDADADWAHFAVSGMTYVVQATSTSPGADLMLELYDACGGNLEGSDDNAFGNDARLIFTAPSDGTYYVKALNHDPATHGSDVTYELSVRAQPSDGVALIVAGHDDNYKLQSNILHCTNTAFRTFLRGGLAKTNLRYLSDVDADARTDADGDMVSDVHADSSSADVQAAITSWAASLADADTPFYLYLMDHGAIDAFLTDGSGDTIAPDELDGWLTTLENATDAPVNVIYEACHSGSFIDELKEISKPGRVVIASTGQENNAYPSRDGALFSDALFTQLGQGSDLYTSFQVAKGAVEATGLWQTPWLDDNGNTVPNDDGDGNVARQRGLPLPGFVDRPPVIDGVTPPPSIVEGDGVLRAQVRDDGGVEVDVWAVVYPPSFEEPAPTEDGTIPELGLPRVVLSDSDGDGEYVGLYEDFTEDGAYHVVVYAQDAGDNQALPVVTAVWTRGWVYLPLVLR